jgi:hypothetical protein
MTRDYQADGFVREFSKTSLAEANRQITSARNATPEVLRDQYRSQIRALRSQGGYAWYWVRK